MVKLFSYHGETFFLPWRKFFLSMEDFFLPWRKFFLSMEDFFLPWRKFFFHGRFFLTMEDFFFPWMFFFNKTISLTPTKWVISIKQREIKEAPKRLISGRPPRGQREQGRLVEGEVAREASQRARHHATEARAGGGMRDLA